MAEASTPPPPPPPMPSSEGVCRKCKARVIMEDIPSRSRKCQKVYMDGTIKCAKCVKIFHVCCLKHAPNRLPFECPECSLHDEMEAQVVFDQPEDDGGATESENDEETQSLSDDDEEFVPDEGTTAVVDVEETAACVGRAIGQVTPVAVGTNVGPPVTAKRKASAGRPTGDHVHAKRQKLPGSAHQQKTKSTGRSTTAKQPYVPIDQPAVTDGEWGNAEAIALAKAVRALPKLPSIEEVKDMYGALVPAGLPVRSGAFLAEKCEHSALLSAVAPSPPTVPDASSHHKPCKIGPGSRPRWKPEEDAIIRRYVDLPCEDVELHYVDFLKEAAKIKLTNGKPRDFVQFKRRLYRLRMEASNQHTPE